MRVKIKVTLISGKELTAELSRSTVDFINDHLEDVFDGIVEKVEAIDENDIM